MEFEDSQKAEAAEPNNRHRRSLPSSSTMASSSEHLTLNIGQAIEDARGALPFNRSLMRSVALASLVPFFLLSLGHYYSLNLILLDYLFVKRDTHRYLGDGSYVWVSGDERADALISTVTAIVSFSFVLLCLSMVATVSASAAINSGRRLTLGESFSKTRGLWREPSVARLYFTILFMGYVLSVVAVVVVSLVTAGDSLRLSTWRVLISLLALFLCLYLGILRSVGLGTFLPGEGGRGAEAPWSTAVALMEERKLQGFFTFFLSLLITHEFSVMGQWHFLGRGFYDEGMEGIQLSPLSVLISILWMLGNCSLFGYVGVRLQV